jgi:hypothetical protein
MSDSDKQGPNAEEIERDEADNLTRRSRKYWWVPFALGAAIFLCELLFDKR